MGEEKRTNGCGEEENGCGEKENGCGEENKWVRRREQMGEEKRTIVLWGHCIYDVFRGGPDPCTSRRALLPSSPLINAYISR